MPTESSPHGAATRRPVVFGGKKIPNLSVRTLDDGTDVYEVRMRMPDGSHPRIKLNATIASEAVRERNGLLVDRDRGVAHENRLMNPTMAELLDEYLAALEARVGIRDAKRRISAATVRGYRTKSRVHVVPFFGRTPVADVTVADVRRLVAHTQAKDLAPATVNHVLSVTTGALNFAQKNGYVERNVARDLARDDRPGSKRQSEPRYLTQAEVDRLLAASSDVYRPIWALLVYAALRIGEALGMQWECIDFKAGTVTVRQQAAPGPGNVVLVPHPKTAASAGSVPMAPALRRELLAHRSRLSTLNLQRVAPHAFLFVGMNGQLLRSTSTIVAFGRAATAAGLNPPGLPKLGHHDLRHTCAALALQSGANPVEVAELMRHADPSVTMRAYAGLTSDGRGAAMRKMLDAGFGL